MSYVQYNSHWNSHPLDIDTLYSGIRPVATVDGAMKRSGVVCSFLYRFARFHFENRPLALVSNLTSTALPRSPSSFLAVHRPQGRSRNTPAEPR